MFDENFGAWLFEVNAYPSMDIGFETDNATGDHEKERSFIDEQIKGEVFSESAKILFTDKESSTFELIYNSETTSEYTWQVYESVFEIYKKLSGVKLGQTITISKFSKLATLLPKSMKVTKTDLELLQCIIIIN